MRRVVFRGWRWQGGQRADVHKGKDEMRFGLGWEIDQHVSFHQLLWNLQIITFFFFFKMSIPPALWLQCGCLFLNSRWSFSQALFISILLFPFGLNILRFPPGTVHFNSSRPIWLEHPEISHPLLFWGQASNASHFSLGQWPSTLLHTGLWGAF